MKDKGPRTLRRRAFVSMALLVCAAFAACHKGLSVGKGGASGNGSIAAGGAVASGGSNGGAGGWRVGDGTTGSGGVRGGAGGTRDSDAGSSGVHGGAGGTQRDAGSGEVRDVAGETPGGAMGAGGARTRPTGTAGVDARAAGAGGFVGSWDGAAGALSSPEPIDDRPPRPEWKPPFTMPLGTPGWQQSTQPICDANQGFFGAGAFDVWADDRGVFALVGEGCAPEMGSSCGKDGTSIKFNSGTGWRLLYQFAPGSTQSPRLWPSVPDGPLLVSGPLDGYGTGTALVDNGVLAFHPTINGYGSYGGFAVGPDPVAYVIDDARLLKYSGGAWATVGDLGDELSLLAVWAGPDGAIAAGYNQTVATQAGTGPLTLMSGVPVGSYQAVWAFGPNDVWFGNRANQLLHYDGRKWQVHATGSRSLDGIESLWGASGTVYFTTRSEFGRWNGTQVEILLRAENDADVFGTIWGRSVNEVFVAIRDGRYRDTACGVAFLLWFDGTQFHQF